MEEKEIEEWKTTREKLDREKAKHREKEERDREKKMEQEDKNNLDEDVMKTKLMQMELDFVLDTPKFELLIKFAPTCVLKSVCLKIVPFEDFMVICGQE